MPKTIDAPNVDPPIDLNMGKMEPVRGTSVEDQIAAMEKRLAEGKPMVETEETEDALRKRGPEEVDVGEQTGDGEEVGRGGEEDSEPEAEGETVEEAEGEGEPEGESEGREEEPVDEEAEEAEEEDEGEAEGEEDEGDVYQASIPGRRQGDPDIKLEIAGLTREEQDGLNRLRNGYLRGEDYRKQLDQLSELRGQVETVARQMDVDPIGYIHSTLDGETKADLAKFLLSQDDIFEEVFPSIRDWEHDDARREGEAAKIERDHMKRSQQAIREQAARDKAREEGDTIVRHLEDLADSLSEKNLSRFMRFALQDLEDYVKAHPKGKLDLETVNNVLKGTGVFETFGIKPSLPSSPGRKPSKVSRKERITEAKARVTEARHTSERFKTRRARKRSAATTAPPGSGAPPASHPFKKGETVEERIAYIEKHGVPKL